MVEEYTFFRKRTLVSTNPVEPTCKIHNLSTLDLIMEKQYLKIIYYYKTPIGLPLGEITAKIRENLSELLSYYPIVIGRLIKNESGKWVIKCNDAGLRFIEARVKGNVENWLVNLNDEKENMLVHWEDMLHNPYHWATFYVQVTEFEGGGMAVGLSCAHIIADPICATMFMKSLSEKMLHGKITIPALFHSLPKHNLSLKNSSYESNSYLINNYKSLFEIPKSNRFMAQNYTTVALEFKEHMIQSCIKLAQLDGSVSDIYSPTFVALVGLLWMCISRVKGLNKRLIDMCICLNMRKNLGLDQGFFGNCMIYNKVYGHDIVVDDLVLLAKTIKTKLGNVTKEEILDLVEWLEQCEDDISRSFVMNSDYLTFINLENVDPYSSMFIEGYEPIRASYYVESGVGRENVFILPPYSYEGQLSRIVMVTLPCDEVMKLCKDKYLSCYSPIVITRPNYKR